MERDPRTGKMRLSTKEVMGVLDTAESNIVLLVKNRLVSPLRNPRNDSFLWGESDIYRAYVALVLLEEYKEKYNGRIKCGDIISEVPRQMRLRKGQILESERWKEVSRRAEKYLLSFSDLRVCAGDTVH